MSAQIGYVVIEWNQASQQPSVARSGDVFDSQDEAAAVAVGYRRRAKTIGRKERYGVAELSPVGEHE